MSIDRIQGTDGIRRPVALLREHAHIGLARPRRHAPIDRPRIVAGQVTAQLLEVEAATAYARRMPSCEQAVNRLPRQERVAASLELDANERVEVRVDSGVGRTAR